MLPFFSISKSIFKENLPKQWNSKRVFGGIEGYEEELYSPSTRYSLSKQECNHLIKLYKGNDINGNSKNVRYFI